MVSTMASAQYLNVKLADGTYRSIKATPNLELSFGEKAGSEVTESAQISTIDGHTVTVNLADNLPASDVIYNTYIEGENVKVKVKTVTTENYGLNCTRDDNVDVPLSDISNGFYTFTIFPVTKDVVVTIGYINVKFDLNNSNLTGKFTANPEDITKIKFSSIISEPNRPFAENYGFRGWYTDKDLTTPWNFYNDRVTQDMTLYAKWTEDPADAQINGHDFVKLAGYYWATENVSEENNATDYYSQENAIAVAKSWSKDGDISWTLPRADQWKALVDNCKWDWVNDDGTGKSGITVTGKEENFEKDHSIFLPAAGYFSVYKDGIQYPGERGYYWSSDSQDFLYFNKEILNISTYDPAQRMSVRPVSAE